MDLTSVRIACTHDPFIFEKKTVKMNHFKIIFGTWNSKKISHEVIMVCPPHETVTVSHCNPNKTRVTADVQLMYVKYRIIQYTAWSIETSQIRLILTIVSREMKHGFQCHSA